MKVSLVIPVKNEKDTIEKLISSVATQTRRPDEVVIVDGGSTDGTPEILDQWARRHSLSNWIQIVRVGEASPGKGRNIGVERASHEWIAFTDAGIRLEHFWMERLVEVAEREDDIEVVYGAYEPIIENMFDQCSALVYVHPKRFRGGGWMRGPVVPSCLLHRKVWERIGGFQDLRAAEDLIFMEAIEREGFKVGWAPNAVVWWHMPADFVSTFRRFTLYSMHNARIGRQHDWHYGVLKKYLHMLVLFLLGGAISPWLLGLPAMYYLIRVFKYIFVRRHGHGIFWLFNPLRFIGVMLVLQTIDLATFVGWGKAYSVTWVRICGQLSLFASFVYRWMPSLHWLRIRRNRTL